MLVNNTLQNFAKYLVSVVITELNLQLLFLFCKEKTNILSLFCLRRYIIGLFLLDIIPRYVLNKILCLIFYFYLLKSLS